MSEPVSTWLKARVQEQTAHASTQDPLSGEMLLAPRPVGVALPSTFIPPTSMGPLVRAVRDGVVNISTTNSSPQLGPQGAGRSLGSGFLITADGYAVTNNHVVAKARQILVKLTDGREFVAEVVGRDPSTDLALLRLRGAQGLPTSFLGDSDRLEVGDWVLAIGNPFGLDHSVTHGMISAKERVIGVGLFDDFIQTDALINPGNSGGPLFNMQGEVVGVTTAIASQGQGIGFAIPINMVKELLPNLKVNGRLARGWLGVNIQDRAKDKASGGAVVVDVFAQSPASAAGLRPGDRVVAVNGRGVENYLALLRRIALLAPGSEARLSLLRDEQPLELSVRLRERPSPEALDQLLSSSRIDELGLVVRDLSPDLASGLGLSAGSGVLVAGVIPRSPAEQAGLTAGDLIVEINRRKVSDTAQLRKSIERAAREPSLVLHYQRGGVDRAVELRHYP